MLGDQLIAITPRLQWSATATRMWWSIAAFLCISLHFFAFHCVSLHFSALFLISLHFSAYHYIPLHFSAFHCILLYFSLFLFISQHFSAFFCILDFITIVRSIPSSYGRHFYYGYDYYWPAAIHCRWFPIEVDWVSDATPARFVALNINIIIINIKISLIALVDISFLLLFSTGNMIVEVLPEDWWGWQWPCRACWGYPGLC